MDARRHDNPGRYQTEIGGRLRLLREALGKTRAQFAELLGTTEGNLKEIEFGRQFPNPEYVRRLCATGLVDFNWIYSGHGRLDDEVRAKLEIRRRNTQKNQPPTQKRSRPSARQTTD